MMFSLVTKYPREYIQHESVILDYFVAILGQINKKDTKKFIFNTLTTISWFCYHKSQNHVSSIVKWIDDSIEKFLSIWGESLVNDSIRYEICRIFNFCIQAPHDVVLNNLESLVWFFKDQMNAPTRTFIANHKAYVEKDQIKKRDLLFSVTSRVFILCQTTRSDSNPQVKKRRLIPIQEEILDILSKSETNLVVLENWILILMNCVMQGHKFDKMDLIVTHLDKIFEAHIDLRFVILECFGQILTWHNFGSFANDLWNLVWKLFSTETSSLIEPIFRILIELIKKNHIVNILEFVPQILDSIYLNKIEFVKVDHVQFLLSLVSFSSIKELKKTISKRKELIFWCMKRDTMDTELIAHLIASLLTNSSFAYSKQEKKHDEQDCIQNIKNLLNPLRQNVPIVTKPKSEVMTFDIDIWRQIVKEFQGSHFHFLEIGLYLINLLGKQIIQTYSSDFVILCSYFEEALKSKKLYEHFRLIPLIHKDLLGNSWKDVISNLISMLESNKESQGTEDDDLMEIVVKASPNPSNQTTLRLSIASKIFQNFEISPKSLWKSSLDDKDVKVQLLACEIYQGDIKTFPILKNLLEKFRFDTSQSQHLFALLKRFSKTNEVKALFEDILSSYSDKQFFEVKLEWIDFLNFLMKFDSATFSEKVGDVLLQILSDENLQVALAASRNFPVLLDYFDASGIVDLIVGPDQYIDNATKTKRDSCIKIAIYTLARLVSNVDLLPSIFFSLTELFSQFPLQVKQAVDYLVSTCGYTSVLDMLRDVELEIILRWYKNLKNFPFSLIGVTNVEFCSLFAHRIVPLLLFDNQKELFADFCKTISRDVSLVIKDNIAHLYSLLMLREDPKIDGSIKKAFGSEFTNALETNFDSILIQIVLLHSTTPTWPYFDDKTIKNGIFKHCKPKDISKQFEVPNRVYTLLEALFERILTTKVLKQRILYLNQLAFLVDNILGDSIKNLGNLKFLLSIIGKCLAFPELAELACKLLVSVLKMVYSDYDCANCIAKMFDILIPALNDLASPSGTNLIKTLISSCPQTLKKYLKYVPERCKIEFASFPDIFDEISEFVIDQEAKSIPWLKRVILDHIDDIKENASKKQDLLTLLIATLGQLIFSDSNHKNDCLECLHQLGLIIPSQNLYFVEFPFTSIELLDNYDPGDYYVKTKANILRLLTEFCLSGEISLIKTCSASLREVLSTTSGLNGFRLCSLDTQAFLKNFYSSSKRLVFEKKAFQIDQIVTFPRRYEDMICEVTYYLLTTLCKDEFYLAVAPVVLLQPLFAEEMFQYVMFDLYQTQKISTREIIKSLIEKLLKNEKTPVKLIKLMVYSLNVIRGHIKKEMKSNQDLREKFLSYEYWFEIPYMSIVYASLSCGAYYSALLYLEAHCRKEKIDITKKDLLFEQESSEVDKLFVEIYQKIPQFDGIMSTQIYGLNSLMTKYQGEQDWNKVLSTYQVMTNTSQVVPGIYHSLIQLGHVSLAKMFVEEHKVELSDMTFENAWRTTNWDLDVSSTNVGFNQYIYKILKSCKSQDFVEAKKMIPKVKNLVFEQLNRPNDLYPSLSRLEMISQLENVVSKKTTPFKITFGPQDHKFQLMEPILKLQLVIYNLLDVKPILPNHMCTLSRFARKVHHFDYTAQLLGSVPTKNTSLLFEEAKLRWDQGDSDLAIQLARNLKNDTLSGEIAYKVGIWLEKTKLEPRNVIKDYLKTSLKTISDKAKSFYTLGQFFENLFLELENKLKSEEWKQGLEIHKEHQKLLKNPLINQTDMEYRIKMKKIEMTTETMKKEILTNENNLQLYILDAVENYGKAMELDAKHALLAFKLTNFWFNNSDRPQIVKRFVGLFDVLYDKFLPLIYQIASRLGSGSTDFSNSVHDLLYKIAKKYPHQSLYQIFALVNGNEFPPDQKGISLRSTETSKIDAAKRLKDQLKRPLPNIVQQMDQLISAYLEVAFLKLATGTSRDKFSSSMKITKIKDLKSLPIPTIPNCDQNETIASFESEFTTAGGINLPKIIYCVSSKNKRYRQLVKGKDDLRQDAVMQQIFGLCNTLLASKSQLIKTYPVIPLSPTAGILGWVENTTPLGTWLWQNGSSGHNRYRPTDISSTKCKKMMESVAEATHEDKLDTFLQVCKVFQPVLHHFFEENFATPLEMFSKRMDYTKSVATSSMVGYIVGLGDRHLQNILIDVKTAELVHIDLGVAFDQGKLLKVPERVPFRLTRDIMDGFGIQGVKGVFKKFAEETLEILRKNGSLLVTIVEVFLHDPLYSWTLTAEKAERVQEEVGTSLIPKKVNRDAVATLLKIKEKLDGYENGELLSVKGQVNSLINQATDPNNLCAMFPGWGPWL